MFRFFYMSLSVYSCILYIFHLSVLFLSTVSVSVISMHQGSESNVISILCMYVLYMWKNWQ